MATTPRPRTTKNTLTDAGIRVGKALARSSAKIEQTGRKARRVAKQLVESTVGKKTKQPAPAIRPKGEAESLLKPNSAMTVEALIGFLAGDIYNYLAETKQVTTADLFRAMKRRDNNTAYICAALGWLAREYKIHFLDDGETIALVE